MLLLETDRPDYPSYCQPRFPTKQQQCWTTHLLSLIAPTFSHQPPNANVDPVGQHVHPVPVVPPPPPVRRPNHPPLPRAPKAARAEPDRSRFCCFCFTVLLDLPVLSQDSDLARTSNRMINHGRGELHRSSRRHSRKRGVAATLHLDPLVPFLQARGNG